MSCVHVLLGVACRVGYFRSVNAPASLKRVDFKVVA